MTNFNVYLKQDMTLIADHIEWEEFITEYGWCEAFKVVSYEVEK